MFSRLQEKIVKKLYPQIFEDIRYYKERSHKWEMNFYLLENEIQSYRKVYTGLKKIIERERQDTCKLVFDKDQNPAIMAISNYKTTYMGDEVIVIRIMNPISERRHELLVNGRIYYYDSKLVIDDIQGGYNKGYGTVAMTEIINIAEQKNIKKLVGNLCNEDLKDHKDRLTHFYEKFGFTVTIETNENNYMNGNIYKGIEGIVGQ